MQFLKKIDYSKAIYFSVVAFAFILPLSRAAISFFVLLLPFLWLMEGELKTKLEMVKSNKVLLSLVILFFLILASVFWSENTSLALRQLRLNSYLLSIFVIATSIKKEQISTIISAFLLGMFISEVIAYGVFFELWTFKEATVENPSPFMMHIDYSVFMAFTSILLLNRLFAKRYDLKEKIIYLFFFLTVTGNLFLAIGRTGQVAFIVAVFVMSIIHYRISIKSVVASFLVLFVVFASAYSFSDTFRVRADAGIKDIKGISQMNLNSSWGIRVAYYMTTYDILKTSPLFGVGAGDFEEETIKILQSKKYDFLSDETRKFMADFHPHSQYLFVALQMGLVGLMLFIYLIYQILRLKISDPEIKELSILFVTVFFVACNAEPLLSKQFTIALFILFVGLFNIETSSIRESKL